MLMRNILIVLVIAIAAVGVYFWLNAGSIVEKVIERVGTDATGTSVEVGSLDLNLNERTAAIHDFTIANPDGFSSDSAFSLGEISVSVESVSRDLIVLSEVVVDSPRVLYEITENGTNIDAIRANIDAYQQRLSGGGGSGGGGSDTKIIIDRLRFTGGQVLATAQGEEVNVDLPPLTLTDIGRASGGETAGQVAAQVAHRLTQHVAETVARSEIERRLGIDGVLDRVRGIFGQ
jgi:hypothetical protein